jgi:hypothetical protein
VLGRPDEYSPLWPKSPYGLYSLWGI